jgi:hypothetical protein
MEKIKLSDKGKLELIKLDKKYELDKIDNNIVASESVSFMKPHKTLNDKFGISDFITKEEIKDDKLRETLNGRFWKLVRSL